VSTGFDDLTYFKHFFLPFGRLSNDWATIFLCSLPFSFYSSFCIEKKYQWIYIVINILVLLTLLVTLSRGGLLSTMIFFVCVFIFAIFYQKEIIRQLFIKFLFISIVMIAISIPLRKSLLTTVSMAQTTSQIRSVEGRLLKWKEALYIFERFPITGVGSGNYALISDRCSLRNKDTFTPRCTNTFLQLLAEKGILGFVAYGSFFVCLCAIVYKRIKSKVFFSAFIALLFREITFSSIFEDNLVLTLSMLIVLFASHSLKEEIK
jgi:O-antigen ligase